MEEDNINLNIVLLNLNSQVNNNKITSYIYTINHTFIYVSRNVSGHTLVTCVRDI